MKYELSACNAYKLLIESQFQVVGPVSLVYVTSKCTTALYFFLKHFY